MLSEKAYYALAEIQARLGLTRHDLGYLVENGLLKASVRVWDAVIEKGEYDRAADGQTFRLPDRSAPFLRPARSARQGCLPAVPRSDRRHRRLRCSEGEYLVLLRPEDGIEVRLDDLVVRRDERDRFERTQRPAPPKLNGHAIKILGDYKEVIVAGRSFHLGACQAEVVRLLHEAAKTEEPWRYGKAVLAAAGSSCTRMADLFKSQRHWRELIASDGRGHYRLAIPLRPSR